MNIYKLKGTSGSVINQSFPLGESLTLGSSEDCDVRIDGPGILPMHAEIKLVDGSLLKLTNLGPGEATLLNGEPVTEAMLGSGDEIRIGTCRWMLQAPGLRPERLLTAEAVKTRSSIWPRVLLWTSLAAATAAVAVLKWKPEWLDFYF